jgi:hypothetical protein
VVVIAALASGCTLVKPDTSSVFSTLPGTWGWEGHKELSCDGTSHTLSFTRDRSVMLLQYTDKSNRVSDNPIPIVRYRVLQAKPNLRMAIEGETRKTPGGELVVWDLVLLSPNRYCWHRTDWRPEGCTAAIERCP